MQVKMKSRQCGDPDDQRQQPVCTGRFTWSIQQDAGDNTLQRTEDDQQI